MDKVKEISQDKEKIRLKIKKYLELENVSILTGAGTSFHLGAPVIRTIPEELKSDLTKEIETYFGKGVEPSYEDLFNCLQADRFIKEKKGEDAEGINDSLAKMQRWLFDNCNTQKTTIHKIYLDDERLKNNRYHYHEVFVKKILQRPNNLKRVNLFTTNYDMAFDYALDNLGVHYINGFMGVHNRFFRPEIYDYDLYYPGQSVSGKVHRAEKVLKYFKMHGSLSWVNTELTVNNTYGIKEITLPEKFESYENNEIMIYPCATKKSFTLDLPYSELFRQFAQAINQPQSVLFCIGYSFYDEHINDIIRQALSIPSFTLIIANYSPLPSLKDLLEELLKISDGNKYNELIKHSIEELNKIIEKDFISIQYLNNIFDNREDNLGKLKEKSNKLSLSWFKKLSAYINSPIEDLRKLNDSRIIILDSNDTDQTTFTGFVENILPWFAVFSITGIFWGLIPTLITSIFIVRGRIYLTNFRAYLYLFLIGCSVTFCCFIWICLIVQNWRATLAFLQLVISGGLSSVIIGHFVIPKCSYKNLKNKL